MTDTYRRYAATKQGIPQFFQPQPTGHRAPSQYAGPLDLWLDRLPAPNSPPSPIMPPVMVPTRKV